MKKYSQGWRPKINTDSTDISVLFHSALLLLIGVEYIALTHQLLIMRGL